MYYGILGVSGIAFVCSMELMPEINEQMKLVPFTDAFRNTLTIVMALDFVACWLIEVVLKRLFSDFRPRDIAERRPDQLERERARKAEEQLLKDEEEEKKRLEKVAEFERRVEERTQKLKRWAEGTPQAGYEQQARQVRAN
jgi:manganese-transporting P-type ATPase